MLHDARRQLPSGLAAHHHKEYLDERVARKVNVSAYIKQCNAALRQAAQAAAAAAHTDAERQAKVEAASERMTSIDVRLSRLLRTIPIEVQAAGLSLAELQTMLMGRRRGNAHAGILGQALRRAGFKRKRLWASTDGQFPARWFPSPEA